MIYQFWNDFNCFILFLEGDEHEADRTDDKTKSSKNEEIRLRLGSNEQVHGQNHLPQYRLNNASSHKTYKGKQTSVDAESSKFLYTYIIHHFSIL